MVRLRLRRVGRKKQASFRLVAAEKEAPRDGRFLEVLGFYNPRTEPSTIKLKEDRIYHWLSQGAQPSEAADSLFRQMGTWDRYERFKAGEKIEKLLEEAAQVEAGREVSPKTRYDTPPTGKGKKAVKSKETAPAAPAVEAKKEEPAKAVAEEPAAKETPIKEPAKEEEAPTKEEVVKEPAKEEKSSKEAETEKEEAKAAAEEKPAAEPKPKAEAKPKAESKAKTKAKAKTKTESKTKTKAKTKTEAKTKTKAKAKTKTKATKKADK